MPQTVIINFDEIILKGKNRKFFEKILRLNIKDALKGFLFSLKHDYGFIILEIKNEKDTPSIINKLQKVSGIAKIVPCMKLEKDIEVLKKEVIKNLKGKPFRTFRVTAKRIDKYFPYKSSEINIIVGDLVLKNFPKTNVKLKDAEININIKVSDKNIFLSTESFQGIGGLPVGSAGKMICLLSGGIDSPVASYLMMRRGVKVVFAHFVNKTLQERSVKDKINKLVDKLSEYNGKSKLYLVPFEEIQKQVIMKVDSKYRMIIYRRIMMRLASQIAKKENAKGLITGDNLSQVASQTLENINVIHEASEFFIASPLIGFNKSETINIARQIGTYEISILPYEDCCSFMVAEHPETRAKLSHIKIIEERLDILEILKKVV